MENKVDLALLRKLISIPSPYPGEEELGRFISGLFLKKGYEVFVQKVEGGRSNIIVEKGTGSRTVLLYSHLDTVAPGEGWTKDPFRPVQEGDRLYGRGSYDMKGGMAVDIGAFLAFAPKNFKLRILFCADEENISKGGYAYASSRFMKDTECVLSPEPAFRHGARGIVTGRIGRAVISIVIKCPPVHFYFYDPGRDINILASQVVAELGGLFKEAGEKKEFVFVRGISSQAKGMSTPGEVRVELDVSVVPPHTNGDMLAKVEKRLKKALAKTGAQYEVSFLKRDTPFLSGYQILDEDPYLNFMKQAVKTATGKQAIPYFRSSVADENIFGAAGKTVLGIGPEGGNAHAGDEWVSVSSLDTLSRVYLDFLQRADMGQAG